MCFTGGFALAMMVDDSVAAPVLAQPSLPFPVGKARAADLNLSPADLTKVKERAAAGCEVLGLRYTGDMAVGTRFDTLDPELGDAFIRVEFPGRKHSTLTAHRQQEGVDRVLAFFREKLLDLISRRVDPICRFSTVEQPAIWVDSTCPVDRTPPSGAEDQPAGRDAGAGGDQHVRDVGELVDRRAAQLADRLGDAVHAVDVGLAELAAVGVERAAGRRPRSRRPR